MLIKINKVDEILKKKKKINVKYLHFNITYTYKKINDDHLMVNYRLKQIIKNNISRFY